MTKEMVNARSGYIGTVELTDHMGDELKVANAARLCHNGHKDVMDASSEKLINFLIREKHLSVFEHCVMTFAIRCPIFVRTHLFRYRTASVTEWSHRGIDKDPSIWAPDTENGEAMYETYSKCIAMYKLLLEKGMPAEQARAILPQGMFTNFLYTIDLRNFMHIWEERSAPSAQEETRSIVRAMAKQANEFYPIVGKYFNWNQEEKEN